MGLQKNQLTISYILIYKETREEKRKAKTDR